jgi:predicted dehydrogenase
VGIIGAGSVVRVQQLPALMALPGVKVVAVCNQSLESAQRVCRRWGLARVARRPREIFAAQDIDAVLIGTWPNRHAEFTIAALRAGKHVLTQARIAPTLKKAQAMKTAARKFPHLVAMICPAPVALAGARFVQELLARGTLGALRLVRVQACNGTYADSRAPLHWRQRFEISGYNTLSLGIYLERLLQWIGPVRWVSGEAATFVRRRRRPGSRRLTRVSIPDQLVVSGQWANGAQLDFVFSGVIGTAGSDRIELHGTDATLVYDVATDTMLLTRRVGGRLVVRPLRIPPSKRVAWSTEEDFIRAIRMPSRARRHTGPSYAAPDFTQGVGYMAVVEAILRSVRTGRRMNVSRRGATA